MLYCSLDYLLDSEHQHESEEKSKSRCQVNVKMDELLKAEQDSAMKQYVHFLGLL